VVWGEIRGAAQAGAVLLWLSSRSVLEEESWSVGFAGK
jgi:hypothetical protein